MPTLRRREKAGEDHLLGRAWLRRGRVREVPATVCAQCRADWIDDAIAAKLEEVVNDARKKHHMVEVTTLSVGSTARRMTPFELRTDINHSASDALRTPNPELQTLNFN